MEGHGQDPAMDGLWSYTAVNGRWTATATEQTSHPLELLTLIARLELRIARLEKTLDEHGIYA